MDIERLVTMANQIGEFFLTEAGEDGAPQEIASHITRFWDPRMRAQIIGHARAGGQGLSDAARRAALLLKPVVAAGSGGG